jgi:hypothetical protein
MKDRIDVNCPEEYHSPSVGELLAREAEARTAAAYPHGVDRSDYSPTSPSSVFPLPDLPQDINRGWWRPPPLSPHHHGPGSYRPYNANRNMETNIAELPSSSIRYVQPSGTFSNTDLASLTSANFGRDPHSSTQVEVASSTYSNPISPNPSTFPRSPLVGGVSPPTTPLMGRWAGDRSSVGQTSVHESSSMGQGQSDRMSGGQRTVDDGASVGQAQIHADGGAAALQGQGQYRDQDHEQNRMSARVSGPLNWPSGMHIHIQSNGQPRLSRDGNSPDHSPTPAGNLNGLVRNGVKRNRDGSPRIGTGELSNADGRPVSEGVARSLTSPTRLNSGPGGARGSYVTAEVAMAGADLAAKKEVAP